MGQPCPLRWSLPRIVMSFVHHPIVAVQSSLLRPLGSSSPRCLQRGMLTENTSKMLLCLESCQSCHSRPAFSGMSKIAHPLLNLCAGSLNMSACQSCLSNFDAVNLRTCSSDDTSVAVTILYLLGNEECPVVLTNCDDVFPRAGSPSISGT